MTLSADLFRRLHAWRHWLHLDALLPGLVLLGVFVWGGAWPPGRAPDEAAGLTSSAASTVAVPAATVPVAPLVLLAPELRVARDFVARRYAVAPEAIAPALHAAQLAAREYRLDALLIVAVIGVESRFNPYAQSPMGAQGLMQIIPRYHRDKIPHDAPPQALLDPVLNVRVGARILHEYIQRQGELGAGLQYYAGALDDEEQGYANKVLAERRLIEQAVRAKS